MTGVEGRLRAIVRRASERTQPGAEIEPEHGPGLAVGLDRSGLVAFASPGGDRFRMVERLASDADDAVELYYGSGAPTLSLEEMRGLYGPDVAVLRLL